MLNNSLKWVYKQQTNDSTCLSGSRIEETHIRSLGSGGSIGFRGRVVA